MDDIVVGEIIPCSDESLYELPFAIATEIPISHQEIQYVNCEPIQRHVQWEVLEANNRYRRIYRDENTRLRLCVLSELRLLFVIVIFIAFLVIMFRH
jgi:hypothetical protein